MKMRPSMHTMATVALLACGVCARADAFDPNAGVPWLRAGAAKPLASDFALRRNMAPLQSIGRDAIEESASYVGSSKSDGAAPFMDWSAGGLPQTGRLSFSATPVDLRAGSGGSFVIGRPSLGDSRGGPNLGNVSQSDLDRELSQLRDSVGRMRYVPQVSLGMNVKF